jgi:hypothetical protein
VSSSATGLSYDELQHYASTFGVSDQQVERDHLISHVLAALATTAVRDRLVFFGGTALARTHLRDLRLSEDIDLLVDGDRGAAAREISAAIDRALARSHGRITWQPALASTTGTSPATLTTDAGLTVAVQLLAAGGYPDWPREAADIEQRYSDVARARLTTLTLDSFVVAKTTAWIDRRAARDLYDLWALAERGAISPSAATLYRAIGPTGELPGDRAFGVAPAIATWTAALAHQCVVAVGPDEAAARVAQSWRDVVH